MSENLQANDINMSSLIELPERAWPDAGLGYLIQRSAIRYTGPRPMLLSPDWETHDRTGSGENVNYVPINSSATASFGEPGYLGTANLNGCTAIAAYYEGRMGRQKVVNTFLAHYDSESQREIGDNRKLILGQKVIDFAGDNPVRVALAYSKKHNPMGIRPAIYDADYFPIETMLEDLKDLPGGSSLVALPYQTTADFTARDRHFGHLLSVGMGGAYTPDISWNGKNIEVGAPPVMDESRRAQLRAMRQAVYEEMEAEHESFID